MRLQNSPTNFGCAGAARSVRLKSIGTRRKMLWVPGIRKSSPRSWGSPLSQKKVLIANVSWNLSHRCRTEEALDAVEQAVLERLPEGSRDASVTLTTDNGTQFTSTRFIEALHRLGITHRRTAYNHPEGNSYIERFHRSLKEEEVWTAEYRNVQEARASIARWIQEYNHNRPHRGVGNRTPHEAFLSFAVDLKNQALTV